MAETGNMGGKTGCAGRSGVETDECACTDSLVSMIVLVLT